MHRKNTKFRKIGFIPPTGENEVSRYLIISSALLLIVERARAKVQNHNFIASASCGIFTDLFSKLRSNKESCNNFVHHRGINRGQYGLISKKRFYATLFCLNYLLRWGKLMIEERACRKTRLGGGDYPSRTICTPPLAKLV